VAVHFAADEPPGVRSDVLGAAGVLGTVNWSNLDLLSGGPSDATVDDDGVADVTGVTVTWTSNNTWSSTGRGEENNTAPAGDDRNLMSGYLDTSDVSVTTVTVEGLDSITTNAYSVYVYVNGGVTNRGGDYTIGADTQSLIDTAAFDGNYVQGENYLLFEGVSGASFMLTATPTTTALFRAPINGIEIVAEAGPPRPMPTRVITPAADDTTCPPSGRGPITVRISKVLEAGENPAEVVTITEDVRGDFFAADITASNGGMATDFPQAPITPVGQFGDHRNIVVNPICDPNNGDTIEGPPGTYTLTNNGEDVWMNGDTFQYAYNAMRGDFDVSVRILSRIPAAASRWGKHGIMARQDITTRSRYTTAQDAVGQAAGLGTDVDNNDDSTMMAGRRTHGGNDNFEIQPYPVNPTEDFDDYCDGVGLDDGSCTVVHHDYLRLERVGNTFNAYSRAVPADPWGPLGSHDWGAGAPQDVLVGLYATSHSTSCFSPIVIGMGEWTVSSGQIVPVSLPGIGARIVWNVTRQQLADGIQYTVDLIQGRATMQGTVGATRIVGPTAITLDCDTRVTNVSCVVNQAGDAQVTWQNHMFADPSVPITVQVVGGDALTVPGNATSAVVPAASLADGFIRICGTNSSGLAACCGFVTEGIIVSDLIAGGDGTGTAAANIVGLNADTGVLETAHNNAGIGNTGDNPQATDPLTLPALDSVFIIDQQLMIINTAGIQFEFGLGDATGGTYNHILKDLTHRIDAGTTDIWAGGQNTWVSCVGLHAAAGVTLNLQTLRDRFGRLGTFSCFAGMDQCAGMVTLYAIASDDGDILDAASVDALGADTGAPLTLDIPDAALFLTLAVGANNSDIGCDHGVFAHALISLRPDTGEPEFHRGDTTGEGTLNITDGVNIFNWLFLGGQTPGCLEAANPNDGAVINITSGVYLLNFLFLGGPSPPAPGPPTTGGGTPCGPDPVGSPSNLGCLQYNGC
jgi:hypothetical protein